MNEQEELLKFAFDNGIIDMALLKNQVNMKKKDKLLEMHKFSIWQGDNGSWYTYLPDQKKGRVLKKKAKREDIENLICEYYEKYSGVTFGTLFNEWIDSKLKFGDIKKQTYDRYYTDFERFFIKTGFNKTDINIIDDIVLEEFIKKTIREQRLTNKAYSGMRTIIIGTMKYAKKHGYTDISPKLFFGDIEISRKSFQHKVIKDEDSVFTQKETAILKDYLWRNPTLMNLGILLTLETGLRIGELSALQWSDIGDNTISVYKTEERFKDDSGNYVFQVRESAKTDAGNRVVILDNESKRILAAIKKINPFGEYLFISRGKRTKGRAFTFKLMKVCDQLGIQRRSMHKIRKTYATKLINAGVDERIIIKQLGHTNINCTRDYYYYNDKDFDEASQQLEVAMTGEK